MLGAALRRPWPSTARVALVAVVWLVAAGGAPVLSASGETLKSAEEIYRALSGGARATGAPASRQSDFSTRGIQLKPKAEEQAGDGSVSVTIHFAYDSAEIDPRSLAQIREIALAVERLDLDRARLWVIGHTDSRGGSEYNQSLSERRAEAVRRALVSGYELPAVKILSRGRGESEPLVSPERSAADFAANRRVELRLSGED